MLMWKKKLWKQCESGVMRSCGSCVSGVKFAIDAGFTELVIEGDNSVDCCHVVHCNA